jgi:MoaA/NifB/PqqE/SkfB family radical SAM enzyme
MKLEGLHILLTYQCNLECDHCFTWGSSRQAGTFTLRRLDDLLSQVKAVPECKWIYFEGGEPFLYYPVLRHGVETAADMGMKVGIVSNGYWATSEWDAMEWLEPFAGLVHDLSISSDLYHWDRDSVRLAKNAERAAQELGIPVGLISIAGLDDIEAACAMGKLPEGETKVMFRGRAAEVLAPHVPKHNWETFTECPCEDLVEPGRLHVDPMGNLHICQGISIGNVFESSLKAICESYRVEDHPIAGPIHAGGPAELARRLGTRHLAGYADACHLCYEARKEMRPEFPTVLVPDAMYGVTET